MREGIKMQLKLNREMIPGETVIVITGPKEETDKILAEFQKVNREKKRRARTPKNGKGETHE